MRDLRVHAQAINARVHHYRDNTGLEVDAIVDAGMGRRAAFEIKLGTTRVEAAARSLLKFANRVDTDRCGMPSALGVIVHSGCGYTRSDGVAVITSRSPRTVTGPEGRGSPPRLEGRNAHPEGRPAAPPHAGSLASGTGTGSIPVLHRPAPTVLRARVPP